MNNHYTTIIHAVRKQLGITLTEYCVADLLYKLATNPDAPVPGWYSGKREALADGLGLSRQGLYKMLNNLFAVDAVEESANGMLRHSKKWYQLAVIEKEEIVKQSDVLAKERDARKRIEARKRKQSLHNVTERDVNGVYTKGKQSLREDVNGVYTKGKQSLQSKGLRIDFDSDLGLTTKKAKIPFSPVADYAEPTHKIETFEPAKVECIALEAGEGEKTSNGAAAMQKIMGEMEAAGDAQLAWLESDKKESDLKTLERILGDMGGVFVDVTPGKEKVPDLPGSRPAKTVKMKPHPGAVFTDPAEKARRIDPKNGAERFGQFKPFDLEAEFAALKTDPFVRESFTLNSRVPAEKFDEYASLFPVWSRGNGETYNNRADVRRHFQGWARGHWKGEQDAKKAAQPNGKDFRPAAEVFAPNKFTGNGLLNPSKKQI